MTLDDDYPLSMTTGAQHTAMVMEDVGVQDPTTLMEQLELKLQQCQHRLIYIRPAPISR